MKRLIRNLYSRSDKPLESQISEIKKILGLGTAAYTAVTAYVTHALATAANTFLVSSEAGAFVEKTAAETRLVLGLMNYEAQEEIAAGESESTIGLEAFCTFISTDSGGDSFILPDGEVVGQQKKIVFRTDGEGSAVVTGSFTGDRDTLTFDNAGEYALLQWDGTDWIALELASMLDMTNAPALTEAS